MMPYASGGRYAGRPVKKESFSESKTAKGVLCEVKGVGKKTEYKLRKLGIFSVRDLLFTFPRRYLDLSHCVPVGEAGIGEYCLFEGVVTEKSPPLIRGRLRIFKAVCDAGGVSVKLVWFNARYVSKTLEVGEEYRFFGKFGEYNGEPEFHNPRFKKAVGARPSGILAIYPTKALLPQGNYRKLVTEALPSCPESIIPHDIRKKYGVGDLKEAVKRLHFPESEKDFEFAERIRLELLVERISAFRIAKNLQKIEKRNRYDAEPDYGKIFKNLSYTLSSSQSEALAEIEKTMRRDEQMRVILCGDVGSGKTVVAMSAGFFAIENGYQAVIAAPTEILARQHFSFLQTLLKDTGVTCGLLTGSMTAAEKRSVYEGCGNGGIKFLVGTHSLFNEKLKFARLGLAVSDEQHRFGVAQRNSLDEKGYICDILTLSATPIPRSMALKAYGVTEFITIERHSEFNVKTRVVTGDKRQKMWEYLAKASERGEKTFIVTPNISDSEGIETETCTALAEELKNYIDEGKLAVLHGRMNAESKGAIMEKFRSGEIGTLVATTVIEVGIDVPDASNMVITDADRFGLATLHQLRGRVGRDGSEAYCFLCTDKPDNRRLRVLTECDDGFKIAEKDFDFRGGGEIFGLRQSGGSALSRVTVEDLNLARKIVDDLDINELAPILESDVSAFRLGEVTLD